MERDDIWATVLFVLCCVLLVTIVTIYILKAKKEQEARERAMNPPQPLVLVVGGGV